MSKMLPKQWFKMQQSLAEAVFAISLNFLKRLSIAFCVLKNRRIHSDFTSVVIVCLAQAAGCHKHSASAGIALLFQAFNLSPSLP